MSCALDYVLFIGFNKLLPKKGQFRIEKFLWLNNCSFLDIENLLFFPRNPFHASYQGVLESPWYWKRSRVSWASRGVPWVQGIVEVTRGPRGLRGSRGSESPRGPSFPGLGPASPINYTRGQFLVKWDSKSRNFTKFISSWVLSGSSNNFESL